LLDRSVNSRVNCFADLPPRLVGCSTAKRFVHLVGSGCSEVLLVRLSAWKPDVGGGLGCSGCRHRSVSARSSLSTVVGSILTMGTIFILVSVGSTPNLRRRIREQIEAEGNRLAKQRQPPGGQGCPRLPEVAVGIHPFGKEMKRRRLRRVQPLVSLLRSSYLCDLLAPARLRRWLLMSAQSTVPIKHNLSGMVC
jgi:hypothetical protein